MCLFCSAVIQHLTHTNPGVIYSKVTTAYLNYLRRSSVPVDHTVVSLFYLRTSNSSKQAKGFELFI